MDDDISKVLELARRLGLPLAQPRPDAPCGPASHRRRSRRSPTPSRDIVCGYRVVVADASESTEPLLPELSHGTVTVGPDIMALPIGVVAGWCALHLTGGVGGTKGALAAARRLRKLSILAAVERCQPEPTSLPQVSHPSASSRANSSILSG